MMISGCVVRLWRTKIKESNATAQRADKLLRYSKNFNYSLNASRDEIEFWPCVRHEHATVANDTANSSNNSDDETFKEYFDSISSREFFNFFSASKYGEIYSRDRVFTREYLCVIRSIAGSQPFCTSTFVIRRTRTFHCPFWYLYLFYFFFFFGTIARTEKILVRRLLFTIIKKNCETMEIERNWICKRLIREIIIKREVSESFETFDRDESDSLHEGIKKKNLQYVSSFKYFPTLRRRL